MSNQYSKNNFSDLTPARYRYKNIDFYKNHRARHERHTYQTNVEWGFINVLCLGMAYFLLQAFIKAKEAGKVYGSSNYATIGIFSVLGTG